MPDLPDPTAGFALTFSSMFRRPVTEEYPEQKEPTAARYHGRHQLNRYDDGLEKCIGCELCAWACPADAILVEGADNTDEERYSPGERYGRVYQINYLRCIGCGLCAWACPYGAREMDLAAGVMKKCTLCVDRIYNETIEAVDRVPSCVRTCPANARHYGDLADPASEVSKMVAARGGMDLMPEQGTRPVNKYLPPRPRRPLAAAPAAQDTAGATGFLAWVDQMLDRI